MNDIFSIKGSTNAKDGRKSECHITLVKLEPLKAALRAAGVCMLLAVLSLFIPLAHFFLVPAFLVAAVVVFVWKKKQSLGLKEIRGVCPCCEEGFLIGPQPLHFPQELLCARCRQVLLVQPEREEDLLKNHPALTSSSGLP